MDKGIEAAYHDRVQHRSQRIVFANGVFDLLHEGHLSLLRFAKAQGDYLVVGLNSDASVKVLKGAKRPIQDQETRRAALLAVGIVDEVVIFDELRTTSIVGRVRPHVIVKGAEYSAEAVRRDDVIPEHIEIRTAPIVHDEHGVKVSTTAIIERRRHGC